MGRNNAHVTKIRKLRRAHKMEACKGPNHRVHSGEANLTPRFMVINSKVKAEIRGR